ncbi:MAG TPA: hypothetical protein VFW59_04125 [Gallionella sp.]|nr:hypothetical protein [Gallionella sp.]
MYPVHDIDAILLLALSRASKRRPAELVDILAAADLDQGVTPNEIKMIDSFYRLSEYGLIREVDGGYTLTEEGEQITSHRRKNSVPLKRIFEIKERLADFNLNGEHAVILLDAKKLSAAVLEHRAAKNSDEKNLLVAKPKPKPVEFNSKRPPQRFPAKKHKHKPKG